MPQTAVVTATTILCPNGHRHGVPETLADCWSYDDDPREVLVTRREFDVATQLLRDGASNKEIGKRLYISEDTVKSHMKALFRRTGARSRDQLIVAVFRGRVRLTPADYAASLLWQATDAPVVH